MIKDAMNKNENVSVNDREMEALKEYFPACFHDGEFDLERFKEYLGDQLVVRNDGYELKFLGKNYGRLLASMDTTTVVVPDEEHNSKPENADSQNIYISGDNLDGLKHLLKSYAHSVQCIYIDPPYNTGSDGFVYNDRFDFTAEELAEKLSIDETHAQRILDLAKRGSASHSAWLMFMYPRLLLARDLLSHDGVIFISIDDNEQANLKLLCDDVFGEENFVASLVWEKKKKGSYLASGISNIKEYVFVYARNRFEFNGLIGEIKTEEETYPCINASNGRDVRIIPAGILCKYREKDFKMNKGDIISDTTMTLKLHSDLVIENGKLAKDLIIEGNWRYGQTAMMEYAKKGELYITQDLYLRRIVREPRYKGLKDLLLRVGDANESRYSYDFDTMNLQEKGWGSNEDADEEQRELFGVQSLMDYPKPVLLIMKLLASLQKNNFTVCDFFSGSATTGEAIMRLNTKVKDIRFILIQLPENLDKKLALATGDDKKKVEKLIDFLDLCNHGHYLDWLGYERIIRAAKKIREELPDTTADLGFKHYMLQEPSADTLDKLEQFDPDLLYAEGDLLAEFGEPTVLVTWLVRDGYGLTSSALPVDFAGYKGFWKDKHLYLIEKGLTNEAIAAILEKYETDTAFNPENIILFGYSFTWSALENLKNNLLQLKDTEKNLRINFEMRF